MDDGFPTPAMQELLINNVDETAVLERITYLVSAFADVFQNYVRIGEQGNIFVCGNEKCYQSLQKDPTNIGNFTMH